MDAARPPGDNPTLPEHVLEAILLTSGTAHLLGVAWQGDRRLLSPRWRHLHDSRCQRLCLRDGLDAATFRLMLAQLPCILSLDLSACRSLTVAGLAPVTTLTLLRELALHAKPRNAALLPRLPLSLQTLTLSGMRLSPAEVAAIRVPHLLDYTLVHVYDVIDLTV